MSLLKTLFGRSAPRYEPHALYAAIIAEGRRAHWYRDGQVPDTLDGRFDMIAAVLSFVLLRLETLGKADEGARLTELFVDDMDGQLREIGIGDLVVGKHIGRMMSALGGRLTAYRAARAGQDTIENAVGRNLYRGAVPDARAVTHVADQLRVLADRLDTLDAHAILAGRLA